MPKPKNLNVKFNSKVALLKYFLGMHIIEVPAAAVKKMGGFKVRLLCKVAKLAVEKAVTKSSITSYLTFSCGIMPLGLGRGYIMFNKARIKQLELKLNSKIRVELALDKSKYGMDLCKELLEVLKQDPDGRKRFDGLTPGKQRNIIHYVSQVKNPDKRVDRAFSLIENLKTLTVGKETMRSILGMAPDETQKLKGGDKEVAAAFAEKVASAGISFEELMGRKKV